jgi:hypothetical protein
MIALLSDRYNFSVVYGGRTTALKYLPGGMFLPLVGHTSSPEMQNALHPVGVSGNVIVFCDKGYSFDENKLFSAFFHRVKTWTGPLPGESWLFLGVVFVAVVGIEVFVEKESRDRHCFETAVFETIRILVRQDDEVDSSKGMKGRILVTFSWICFILLQIYEGRFTSLILVPPEVAIPSSWGKICFGYFTDDGML